jgi:hypothetical protein
MRVSRSASNLRALTPAAFALLVTLGLTGCRLHVNHVRVGDPVGLEATASFELGKATLQDVLTKVGAPDDVAWIGSEDVLIYESATLHGTRWNLDNPANFANKITPQGFAGELVAVAIFTAGRSIAGPMGVSVPSRPPPGRFMPQETPEIMGAFGKPLILNGDVSGDEQVRFFFDRDHFILTRIEVAHGSPESSIAGKTFLR